MTKNYYYDGDRLIAEKWSTGAYLLYHYDETGSPYAITHSATGGGYAKYYLIKNLQGDVLQIRNVNNAVVANYEYDAWGRVVSVKYANGNDINVSNHIGVINPIRYRGYYYDSETGFYYLKSRYYDPAICRFISADGRIDLNDATTNLNLFAYCGNDPVNRADPSGKYFLALVLISTMIAFPIVEYGVGVATAATELAGVVYLKGKGYDAAASMYEHAFCGRGEDLTTDTVSPILIEKLKNSSSLNKKLGKEMTPGKTAFDTYDSSIEFKRDSEADLYYAAQKVNYRAWGRKENGKWKIDIIVWDTYDFGEYRIISEGFSFANAANDLGTTLEIMGEMDPYSWWARYEYWY